MNDIQSDLGILHSLLSEHMPGITLVVFKKNGIEPDVDKITKIVHKICEEYMSKIPLTESILVAQILLQEIYNQVNKQAKELSKEEPKNKVLLDFLKAYN